MPEKDCGGWDLTAFCCNVATNTMRNLWSRGQISLSPACFAFFRADYAGFPSWAEMLQISYGLVECFVVNAAWSRVSREAFPKTTWSKSGFRVGDGAKSEGR